MDTRAVDIAVPVYNGYDDLVKCVESLKKYTDLSKHRVILIDDCSPDERVRSFLLDEAEFTQAQKIAAENIVKYFAGEEVLGRIV